MTSCLRTLTMACARYGLTSCAPLPAPHAQLAAPGVGRDGVTVDQEPLSAAAVDDGGDWTRLLDKTTVLPMDREVWIALVAHRLQRQWRTVDPDLLDEVAGDLWADERLRNMAPADAASCWLEPIAGLDWSRPVEVVAPGAPRVR